MLGTWAYVIISELGTPHVGHGHVGLPHVLDLTVTWSFFWPGESRGSSKTLLLLALFYQSTSSCLKVRVGVGWVHILLFSFFGGLLFNLGVCWDRDLNLDQGLSIAHFETLSC